MAHAQLTFLLATLAVAVPGCGHGSGEPTTQVNVATPGAAATMTRSGGDLQSGPVSAALATPLSVTVTDASANVVSGVTVNWAAVTGGGSMGAPTSVTNALGVTTMIWTLGPTLGQQTATATVTGLTGSPAAFSATADAAVPAFTLASLAAGAYHTCGLTAGGAAYCWGSDSAGQLGDGTTTDRSTPTPVVGGLVFASLTLGLRHTCGLTAGGEAYCWGDNIEGALGDGTTTDRHVPAHVAGGPAFANLSAGFDSSCGLTAAGAAYCWGDNSVGQLGDGTMTSRSTPTPVAGGLVFASLAAGATCGLTTGGAAYCWGYNQSGVLAVGTLTTYILTPQPVVGGLVFASLTGGSIACGLTTGGAAYCWGNNSKGELGDGLGTYEATTPTKVASILVFASLTANGGNTCGLTAGGVAYCWGDNDYGEVGNGTTGPNRGVTLPAPVAGGLVFASLAVGAFHTCGLTAVHAVYCWGYNFYGQLGDGTTTDRSVPTRVISP